VFIVGYHTARPMPSIAPAEWVHQIRDAFPGLPRANDSLFSHTSDTPRNHPGPRHPRRPAALTGEL